MLSWSVRQRLNLLLSTVPQGKRKQVPKKELHRWWITNAGRLVYREDSHRSCSQGEYRLRHRLRHRQWHLNLALRTVFLTFWTVLDTVNKTVSSTTYPSENDRSDSSVQVTIVLTLTAFAVVVAAFALAFAAFALAVTPSFRDWSF
jgi:hypothetical protein